MVARLVLFLLLLANGVALAPSASAQANHILEFRRTSHSADCDIGELFVDGKIVALFSATPDLVDSRLRSNPFVGDQLITATFSSPWPGLSGIQKGFELKSDGTANLIRVVTLNRNSYTNYTRPRAKKYSIPADTIMLGTFIEARECKIMSSMEDSIYRYDITAERPTLLMSRSIFDGKLAFDPYPIGTVAHVIALVSDASDQVRIEAGAIKLSRSGAIPSGAGVGLGSSCLFPHEHMSNTRITQGGKTYNRYDDVWLCPNFALQGGDGNEAIEMHRRPNYIEFHTIRECGNVFGVPIPRSYVVDRRDDGSGGALWTRCLGNESYVKLSDTSIIRFGTE